MMRKIQHTKYIKQATHTSNAKADFSEENSSFSADKTRLPTDIRTDGRTQPQTVMRCEI